MRCADKTYVHLVSGSRRTLCCGKTLVGAAYTDRPESVTCPEGIEPISVTRTADAQTLGHRVQAVTRQGDVHAEGVVFSYTDGPSVGITLDSGDRINWRADLIRDLGPVPETMHVPGDQPVPFTPRASADYTSPELLRETPRYTLDEERELLNPLDRKALGIVRDAIHRLTARGGYRIPAYGDTEAYEFRLILHRWDPSNPLEETAVIDLDDLDDLLAFAQHAAGNPDVERPKVYTLAEARPLILAELCRQQGGHDIKSNVINCAGGPVHTSVRCTRCGATFSEDPR